MKLYLNLEDYQAKVLFDEISELKSFVMVKLKMMEFFLTCWNGNKPIKRPYVCLDLDLQRAFLINTNAEKKITFVFDLLPKTATPLFADDGNYIKSFNLKGRNCIATSVEVSQALTLLKLYTNRDDNLYCYSAADNDEIIGDSSKQLFEYLMFSEPGYIRYDHDYQNFDAITHPEDHLDVNYSEPAHFKLGLKYPIKDDEVNNLLDLNKRCTLLDFNTTYTRSSKKKKPKKKKGKKHQKHGSKKHK